MDQNILKNYPQVDNYLNTSNNELLINKLNIMILLIRKHMGFNDENKPYYASMTSLNFDSDFVEKSYAENKKLLERCIDCAIICVKSSMDKAKIDDPQCLRKIVSSLCNYLPRGKENKLSAGACDVDEQNN